MGNSCKEGTCSQGEHGEGSESTEGAITPHRKQSIAMGPKGVHLSTFDEAWRFSEAVCASGFAPKGLNRAGVLIAIQMGAELGLTPMASLQNIAVINGRPSLWGDAMLAVCMASGVFDGEAFEERIEDGQKKGDLVATCTVRRLPQGKPITRSFSLADAQQAGLLAKSGPWQQYPKRMLQMRARAFALRDAFADVLRGISCAEEVRDSEANSKQTPPTTIEQITRASKVLEKTGTEITATYGRCIYCDTALIKSDDGEYVCPVCVTIG